MRERIWLTQRFRIAARVHAGQADKAGLPYIDHPKRVAARLATSELQAVAFLHDVLEDTDVSVGIWPPRPSRKRSSTASWR